MSITSEFYFDRADESARDAASASLDMVRERCLRSEAAWRALAERHKKGQSMREQRIIDKADAEAEPRAPDGRA